MTRVSFVFIVFLAFLLPGCGGSDGNNKVVTDQELDIVGVWQSRCLSDRNQINQFVFNNDGSMSLTEELFDGQGCERSAGLLVSVGSFFLGDTVITDSSVVATNLDLVFTGGDRSGATQLDIVDRGQAELYFGVFSVGLERPTDLDFDNPYRLQD